MSGAGQAEQPDGGGHTGADALKCASADAVEGAGAGQDQLVTAEQTDGDGWLPDGLDPAAQLS